MTIKFANNFTDKHYRTPAPGRPALFGLVLYLSSISLPAFGADPVYNYGDQLQWDRFTYGEQSNFSHGGADPVPARVRKQQMEADAARAKVQSEQKVPVGSFQVPSWVVTTAPAYQRPIEIINSGPRSDSTIPSVGSTFVTAIPYSGFAGSWTAPYWGRGGWYGVPNLGATLGLPGAARAYTLAGGLPGYGWGGYGWGSWGVPNLGATLGLPGAARAYTLGGGLPGLGWGGYGWGGYGWGGYGWGGWSPAAAALGFRRGAICDPGGGRVFQSAPSKASGNYYQPSTVDESASGSYYASGSSQAILPPSEPPPKDYWGPEGNPFKQQMSNP